MMTVEDLARELLTLEPQKNQARLAFYHFVKNLLPLEKPFTQEMLDAFYDRALTLTHWQTNKKSLGETVRHDLELIAKRRPFSFELDQALHSCDIQVVNLESSRDFSALLSKGVKKLESAGEKVRLFQLRQGHTHTPQEVLSVRLQKSGSLVVEIYPSVAMIVDGELNLVRPHSRLQYTIDLDFDPEVDQILATSLMRVARFRQNDKSSYDKIVREKNGVKVGTKLTGQFIQGTNFARCESFDKPASEVTELLQALKRIERFYVNPASDPYYQDLYDTLKIASPEGDILL